jgi:hypothetical protein
MKVHRARSRVILSALAIAVAAPTARADVIAIGPAAFSGAPQITFVGLPDGLGVHGLVVAGVQFLYSFGAGQVIIDAGPGITNNVAPPNIVSIGNEDGILVLNFPSPQTLFGFGFALLNGIPGANAVNITLFNGATNVGSLFYVGNPDPTFVGGFAGIQSSVAFNQAQLTFNPAATAFAIDNIRFADVTTVTPEPATLTLLLTGVIGIAAFRRRRLRSGSN